MFKAIFKALKAISYLLTGKFTKFKETLNTNPAVMAASYDTIIENKRNSLREYEDSVAKLMTQEEKYKYDLKILLEEVVSLERAKLGAGNKAKAMLQSTFNGDITAARLNVEFVKIEANFKDFSSTLEEKQKRIKEKEEKVKEYSKKVNEQKIALVKLRKDLTNISSEKQEAIADVIAAKEEIKISKSGTVFTEDNTEQELEALRQARQNTLAQAKIASETVGLGNSFDNDYESYLSAGSEADAEFEALLGVAKKVDSSEENYKLENSEKISVTE